MAQIWPQNGSKPSATCRQDKLPFNQSARSEDQKKRAHRSRTPDVGAKVISSWPPGLQDPVLQDIVINTPDLADLALPEVAGVVIKTLCLRDLPPSALLPGKCSGCRTPRSASSKLRHTPDVQHPRCATCKTRHHLTCNTYACNRQSCKSQMSASQLPTS